MFFSPLGVFIWVGSAALSGFISLSDVAAESANTLPPAGRTSTTSSELFDNMPKIKASNYKSGLTKLETSSSSSSSSTLSFCKLRAPPVCRAAPTPLLRPRSTSASRLARPCRSSLLDRWLLPGRAPTTTNESSGSHPAGGQRGVFNAHTRLGQQKEAARL